MSSARTRVYKRKSMRGKKSKTWSSYVSRGVTSNTLVRKLPYFSNIDIDAGIGVAAGHIFTANGLFDPDITGVGHQPLGFDQYMALYDHYKVLGSVITVEYFPITASTDRSDLLVVGVNLNDGLAIATNVEQLVENNSSYSSLSNGGGASIKKLKKTFNIKKFFSGRALGAADLLGSDSANPEEQAFYQVWVASCSGGNPAAVCCSVKIDYIVQFTEQKLIAQS